MMLLALSLLAIARSPRRRRLVSTCLQQSRRVALGNPAIHADRIAGRYNSSGSTTFRTRKGIAQLEKCLTDRLSKVGEVTSVPIEGMKTLMYSTTDEPPMMINIDPPSVIVTTKFAIGTQPIVKGCL